MTPDPFDHDGRADAVRVSELGPGDLIGFGVAEHLTFLVERVEAIGEDVYRLTLTADPLQRGARLLGAVTVEVDGAEWLDRFGF